MIGIRKSERFEDLMVRKVWSFRPDAGGTTIPDDIKRDVRKRILAVAEEHFKGRYFRIDIIFKGQFCNIDDTPTHLCRLRYFGDGRWSYAFYANSSERYVQAVFRSGSFYGKPEDAFMQAVTAYLTG